MASLPGLATQEEMSSKRARIAGLVLTVLLLTWFWDSLFLLPLKLLVVFFHEMGHAIAVLLTGGGVVDLAVGMDQGGHTISRGGNRFIILNAGYLGSLLFGVALLLVKTPRGAKRTCVVLALTLLGAATLWVRPLVSFAALFCVATGGGFLWLSRRTDAAESLIRVLGVFSVLYALGDIRDDVFRMPGGVVTDATMLAEHTGLPSVLWGLLWTGAGVLVLWRLRRVLV